MAPRNEPVLTKPDETNPVTARSSASPLQDESVAKRVRLPNTGKLSAAGAIGDRFDPVGGVAGTVAEPIRDASAMPTRT